MFVQHAYPFQLSCALLKVHDPSGGGFGLGQTCIHMLLIQIPNDARTGQLRCGSSHYVHTERM